MASWSDIEPSASVVVPLRPSPVDMAWVVYSVGMRRSVFAEPSALTSSVGRKMAWEVGQPARPAALSLQHGAPQRERLVGERVARVEVSDDPRARFEFPLQLARPPARVAMEQAQRIQRAHHFERIGREVDRP